MVRRGVYIVDTEEDNAATVRVGSVVRIRGQSVPEQDVAVVDSREGNGLHQLTAWALFVLLLAITFIQMRLMRANDSDTN